MAAKQIWVAYNHIPGGQVMVTHFEIVTRRRKVGDDKVEEVTFTAETQLEGFKKSDFVALKMKGKELVKGQVLVFPTNEELPKDPAPHVIAWAEKQGIEQIKAAVEIAKENEANKRVAALEEKLAEQSGQIAQLLEIVKSMKGASATAAPKKEEAPSA